MGKTKNEKCADNDDIYDTVITNVSMTEIRKKLVSYND